jgi:integrase
VKERALLLEQFELKRKELNPQALDRVTPELAEQLAHRVRTGLLAMDDTMRDRPEVAEFMLDVSHAIKLRSGLTISKAPREPQRSASPLDGLTHMQALEIAQLNQERGQHGAMLVARRNLSAVLPLAQAEAKRMGFSFSENTPGAVDALKVVLGAYREALHDAARRDAGEVVTTPQQALTRPPAPAPEPLTLRDVYDRWKAASKERSADAESACLRAVLLCEECLGAVGVAQLTRAQGDTFRAWLLTKGAASKTSRDRFTWVKTLLKYATQDLEVIPKSPWAGLDIAHKTTAKRRPWKAEELAKLFSQPLFTRYELPKEWRAGQAAAYWVPVIGLFTGARISELAQLRTEDIVTTGSIPMLSITDAGEGQQVKTSASVRSIPIHPELVRLGLLDYVEAMKKAGEAALWPQLKLRKGRPGGFISDWFGEYRKASGLTEQYPDFHCFRHTVRTLMSRAGVDHKVQDCITGHETGGSTGTKVYQHTDEQELFHAVCCLAYPGLVLPKVYRPQHSLGTPPPSNT